MSDDLKRVTELRGRLDNLRQRVERAKGALDSTLRRLKEEFGVASLEDAEVELRRMKGQRKSQEKRLSRALREFEKKYGDILK